MMEFIIRALCTISALFFFTMAGITAVMQDIRICSLCCILGSTLFVVACGKRITWIHRSINYGYGLIMILLNLIPNNFLFIFFPLNYVYFLTH